MGILNNTDHDFSSSRYYRRFVLIVDSFSRSYASYSMDLYEYALNKSKQKRYSIK